MADWLILVLTFTSGSGTLQSTIVQFGTLTDGVLSITSIKDEDDMVSDLANARLNARQLMMKIKQGFGTGVNITFPRESEVETVMANHPADYHIQIYGDGSHTTPMT